MVDNDISNDRDSKVDEEGESDKDSASNADGRNMEVDVQGGAADVSPVLPARAVSVDDVSADQECSPADRCETFVSSAEIRFTPPGDNAGVNLADGASPADSGDLPVLAGPRTRGRQLGRSADRVDSLKSRSPDRRVLRSRSRQPSRDPKQRSILECLGGAGGASSKGDEGSDGGLGNQSAATTNDTNGRG